MAEDLKALPGFSRPTQAWAAAEAANEIAALRTDNERLKNRGDDPCERCGAAYNMSALVSDEVWAKISGRTDSRGYLCLWCMDELAVAQGMAREPVELSFPGKALSSITPGNIDKDVAFMWKWAIGLQARIEELKAALDQIRSMSSDYHNLSEIYDRAVTVLLAGEEKEG